VRIFAAPGVELVVNAPGRGGFARHSHDEYVISANVCGVEHVRLDRSDFTVGTTEITTYNPGEVQSCRTEVGDEERWACVSLYVDVATLSGLAGQDAEFRRPVLDDPLLRRELVGLGLTPATSRTAGRVEALLTRVLTGADLGPPREDAPCRTAVGWLAPAGDLTTLRVAELAGLLGWSRETFTRRFTAVTGTPPYAWHLQHRLRTARRLLTRGVPPADVAARLGFSDQAHLHRHYTSAYGHTPGEAWCGDLDLATDHPAAATR
jgi:AraC family chemosensory pili system transcriptional regulator ChpD